MNSPAAAQQKPRYKSTNLDSNPAIVSRFYTARGQLQGVGWGQNLSTSYVYHPDGSVNYQARENHVTTSYGYDGRGMIDWLKHRYDAGVPEEAHDLAYRDYWRDDRDRIVGWKRGTDSFYNGMENGQGNRYGYDDEGQLTSASYRVPNPEPGGTPGPSLRTDIFHYDELGNRKGWNYLASRGDMLFEGKNTGLNQYFSWGNLTHPDPRLRWYTTTNYDDDLGWDGPEHANGALMQDGWITAGFNALNQPVQMWSKQYPGGDSAPWMWFGYDPLGRCVKRWVGPIGSPPNNPPTYFYYDGWNLIEEGSSGAVPIRVYVHGGRVDEIVASWGGGLWSYHQYDAQGHCIMLTDLSGVIREQYDYDAFGRPYVYTAGGSNTGSYSPYNNRFLFTGREWIKEMRVYDYRNRMYQPELGRFLQPDPTGFDAGDDNLYRYCDNDPVNNSDPTGLYINLIHEGGGDWITGSDGLSAWDRDHGMGMNKWQAGMDGAGGGGTDAKLLGRGVPIDVSNASELAGRRSRASLEKAIGIINRKQGELSDDDVTVIRNVKRITVDVPGKRTGISPQTGVMNFRSTYIAKSSAAWLASVLGHDGYHVAQHQRGAVFDRSTRPGLEREANEFQMRVGRVFGLTARELQHIQLDTHTVDNTNPY